MAYTSVGNLESYRGVLPPALCGANILRMNSYSSHVSAVYVNGRPSVILIESTEIPQKDCSKPVLGAIVIAPDEWDYAHQIVLDVIQGLKSCQSTFEFLIPWRRPPKSSKRDDGLVRSFVANTIIWRKICRASSSSLGELCYAAAQLALSEEYAVERLRVRQMGQGAPRCNDLLISGKSSVETKMIIPHRGDLKWLRTCLWYIFQQRTWSGTVEVCFDEPITKQHWNLTAEYPQVTFFTTKPYGVGPYVARHTLTVESDESFIAFQDSDDVPCYDRLITLQQEMDRRCCDILGSHELRIDELTGEVRAFRFPLDVYEALKIETGHPLFHPTSLIRKQAYIQTGGFSTRWTYGADLQFLLRAFFTIRRIENVDAFLYIRRVHTGSLTTAPNTALDAPSRLRKSRRWKCDFNEVASGRLSLGRSSLRPQHARQMPRVVRL